MPTSNSSSRLTRLAAALCLVSALAASPAYADDEREFQEHYQRGLQLYKLNFLRPAIKEFVAAYAANPLPRLLYNIAQLQRRLGDYKESAESYELYLRTETDITQERRAEVQRYVEALRSSTGGTIAALPPEPGSPPGQNPDAPRENKADPSEPPALLLILPPTATGKAGRYMFNMGLGYALPFFQGEDAGVRGLGLRPEFGIAVSQNRNAYIILSPQIQLIESFFSFLFSIGFQYDFPILTRGLFLYLRGSAGYMLGIAVDRNSTTGENSVEIAHYGAILPELGIKYIVNGKFNFGFEPLAFPITFTASSAQGSYRQMFYAGVNF